MMHMRCLALAFALVTPAAMGAQTLAAFRASLDATFKSAPPELTRYHGLTSYGETFSRRGRGAESLRTLQSLFGDAKRLGVLARPDAAVVALCHELIVYRMPEGMDCLRLFAQARTGAALDYLPVGILAAGEAGERLAIEHLRDRSRAARIQWSGLLAQFAIYPSSSGAIISAAKSESNAEVKANELRALAKLADPSALEFVSHNTGSRQDAIQAAALFAYTELRGYDALATLKQIKPAGAASAQELADSIGYLESEASAKNMFGTQMDNDPGFLERFGDMQNPIVDWLNKRHPGRLTPEDKQRLFDLLAESKGFGLEAVKGDLYAVVARADMEPLLRIRESVWISPNDFAAGRTKSIDLLIRSIRREGR